MLLRIIGLTENITATFISLLLSIATTYILKIPPAENDLLASLWIPVFSWVPYTLWLITGALFLAYIVRRLFSR